ncbi:MAG: 16S rRNA (guanine(966)-N(2))-methyltransferase RsmD [Oscillospiraceae bacterium]
MRVITGVARGVRLKSVDGLDVRPTTEKVKEAVLSSVQFDIGGAKVLDLFCGSGQMGIEALSRGTDFAYFVDNSKKSYDVCKENLTKCGLFSNSKLLCMDYSSFLIGVNDTFDIAFMDPPYSHDFILPALTLLVEKMNESGIILCEHENTDKVPDTVGDFSIYRQYNYSRISVTAYRKHNKDGADNN